MFDSSEVTELMPVYSHIVVDGEIVVAVGRPARRADRRWSLNNFLESAVVVELFHDEVRIIELVDPLRDIRFGVPLRFAGLSIDEDRASMFLPFHQPIR